MTGTGSSGGPRVALVTGGAGGIGSAICRRLARDGARVLVAGRALDRCREVARGLCDEGGEAWALALDVTDEVSVGRAAERGAELAGAPIDALVNNAGVAISAPLVGGEGQDLFARHLEVNFHGARRVLEALLPSMLAEGGGSVVQIASSAGLRGYAYVAAYAASKHALVGYSRSAALELAGRGVAVNVVCPHYVDTPMVDRAVERVVESTGRSTAEAREFFVGQNPGGRLVGVDEVAEATAELLRGDRTGVVLELLGGSRREVDAGARHGRATGRGR